MSNNDNPLAVTIKEAQISETDASLLQTTFAPYFKRAEEWRKKAESISVTSVDDKEAMKNAREARLHLKNIRVDVEKTRKELKEESLRKGKAIDGMANVIKFLIVPIEEHLDKQEKFVEIQEQKRKKELKIKREQELMEIEVDTSFYNLGDMPDEQYAKLLESSTQAYNMAKEAAEKANQERIAKEKAEAKERERIRVENERLKKEAVEREKKLEAEREKARIEREKAEAEQKKEVAAQQAKLEAERKERERIEAEIKAKQEAEEKARQEAEEKARQEQLAPDKEKLVSLANRITSIEMPDVESKEAKAVIQKTIDMLSKASQFVKTESLAL
ncbi:IgA-specific serine endopeptidase autotransporter precursor [Symmachiella dynata]|uniref:hypothetical protein n=1 Tax=Symmachiella dynata TaxID=2527995 RepID=UPI00118C75F5|nr:hypothetical protein [Symmachiella dynata]QDT46210.1 IgA-specific serine endopeptidase autotransporter precursor [Symmachiella dynata]